MHHVSPSLWMDHDSLYVEKKNTIIYSYDLGWGHRFTGRSPLRQYASLLTNLRKNIIKLTKHKYLLKQDDASTSRFIIVIITLLSVFEKFPMKRVMFYTHIRYLYITLYKVIL